MTLEDEEWKERVAQLRRDLTDLESRIESAFLHDERGNPDYSGHRLTHREQVTRAEDIKRAKASILKNITTWALIGVLTVIGSNFAQAYFGAILLSLK